MLNQPTSSPMMTRMLGLRCCCCCAAVGILATNTARNDPIKLSQSFRLILMTFHPVLFVKETRSGTPPHAPIVSHLRANYGSGESRRILPLRAMGKSPQNWELFTQFPPEDSGYLVHRVLVDVVRSPR